MGNFLSLSKFGGSQKLLQVMKMNDGKILEFRSPIRVRDLLVEYPNSYVGMFKEATQPLPLDYKLKFGNVYYLLPSLTNPSQKTLTITEGVSSSVNDGVRRIRVVITRNQLEQILSNQVTVEDVIMAAKTCNLQKLEAIPEEIERSCS